MKTMKLKGLLINLDNVSAIQWDDNLGLSIYGIATEDDGNGFNAIQAIVYREKSPVAKFAYDKLCEYALYDFDEMYQDKIKPFDIIQIFDKTWRVVNRSTHTVVDDTPRDKQSAQLEANRRNAMVQS